MMDLFMGLLVKKLCSIKLHNYGEMERDFFQNKRCTRGFTAETQRAQRNQYEPWAVSRDALLLRIPVYLIDLINTIN